ncbi:sensor histidine kinase [Granulicella cerasi]|uniref:histidine kinase n=1 Tax=Granulicella cerasi TaxID=741063 RepID=A0ABW1ZDC9_9BACT|nr:histidine kinase [Granulicella cerasi]
MDPKLILISLLVELGVAAAVASSLARSWRFKRLLLRENRSGADTLRLMAWMIVPLMLGVLVRVRVPNFLAADLSFQATVIVSLILGPGAGALGGLLLALPALGHHEWLAPFVNVAVAALFGAYGRLVDREAIWDFTPLIDLSLYRWVRRTMSRPHLDRQITLLGLITAVQFGLTVIAHFYPRQYFTLHSKQWGIDILVCVCAPVVVGIPLKIWSAVRIEQKLEEQSRLLLEARLDALQRQINPHFLFNTLNSISSLIRSKPELARQMIVKLGNILRALLREREAFVPLSEELAFTDDYLGIEVVRFGEKLRVVKEIAPETLEIVVPTMLLQPLIENSIKHGLEPRINGGTVTLRSRLVGEKLLLEVEDDGVGVEPGRDITAPTSGLVREGFGIGMSNVRERMQVLYGDDAVVDMVSRPGRGTKVSLLMPVADAMSQTAQASR